MGNVVMALISYHRHMNNETSSITVSRLGVALALIAALMLAFCVSQWPSTASADPFGDCNNQSPCRPDNKDASYCFGDTLAGNGMQNAAGYGMGNLVAQTSFTKNYQNDCGSNTDIVFKADPTLGARGITVCMSYINNNTRCNRNLVIFNPNYLVNTLNKNKTACHEVGHTGGMGETNMTNDCMISGQVSADHIHYNGHHVDHLNNQN